MSDAMAGEIVHIELRSSDFVRSAAFYEKLFGWRTDGAQSGGHLVFEPPGGVQGSWIRTALIQAPGPVPFVAVDDLEATLAEVEKNGGRVLVPRLSLAGRGVFGLFADPDGNVIGALVTRPDGTATADSSPASAAPSKTARPARNGGSAEKKPAASKRAPAAKPARKR